MTILISLLRIANEAVVFPDAACIVFGTSDDGVAIVVKCAGENFVFVALPWVGSQALNFCACLRRPDTARLVATRRDYLISLRVKGDFTDFIFVALQDGCAGSSEYVVDACHAVSTRSS
jgi:hypothetical protein